MDKNYLVAWLPFDTSTTADKCGNSWTAYGSPTIANAALQLDGSSYLKMAEQFSFTGQPFTVTCKFSGTSNTTGGDVCLWQMYIGNSNRIQLGIETSGRLNLWKDSDSTVYIQTAESVLEGQIHHVEADFDGATWYLFLDGILIGTKAHTCTARDYELYIGTNYQTNRKFTGTIDEFMIFDGVALHTTNFTPPTDSDYAALKVDLGAKVAQYLSFTGSAGCYGELPLGVLAGATTFTIEAKFSTTSTKNASDAWQWGTIIGREIPMFGKDDFGFCVNDGKLCFWASPASKGSSNRNTQTVTSSAIVNDGKIHKAAIVSNADGSIDLYCDGVNVAHADNVNAKITDAQTILIAYDSDSNSYLQMDLWEARFWSIARTQGQIFADIQGDEAGLEAWYIPNGSATLVDGSINGRDATLYGSPAYTYVDILPIDLSFDVVRRVFTPWRYVNAGTADTLTISGNTLTDLPESKSITGTAFYQTARQKCFDIPTTDEIWIKFDLYHYSGTSRFRVYDDKNGSTANGFVLTQNSSTQVALWSWDGSANYQRETFDGVLKANTLQTWLLHMVSGANGGLLELWCDGSFVGAYSGNVNNGEDFANVYLQTDNANNLFSNVIISNAEIELGEGWQIFTFDTERQVAKAFDFDFDVERQVKNIVPFQLDFDVELKELLPVTIAADVERKVIVLVDFSADVELLALMLVDFIADLARNIKANINLYKTDVSEYFSGGSSVPIIIPTQEVVPPATDSEAVTQSIEITIAEQQITDQVKVVTAIPLDIMYPVQGQYLDYCCDMRVERVSKQGILYTADCCSDLDALLYTQLAYTLKQKTTWYQEGSDGEEQEIETYYPPASEHVEKIANALGLTPVMQFDNFLSTLLFDDLGGLTYADIIRDVFGWSARVPHMLINCYIRNGKLFVIQRGHESNVIDISSADMTLPIFTHELVRTTWGSSPNSATETREQVTRNFVPADSIAGGGSSSGDDSGGGDSGGDSGDDSEQEKSWLNVGSVTVSDSSGTTTTTYSYDSNGILRKTVAVFTSRIDSKESSTTTTTNSYNSDKLLSKTEVDVSHPYNHTADTRTVTTYGYKTLANNQKFLSTEMVTMYENGKWVDTRVTTKSPTGRGQGATTDNSGNTDTGGNISDDRATPYSEKKAAELIKSLPENATDSDGQFVDGVSLYDSSFPIHDTATLIRLTEALKWLNRRTREIVTLSIYNFPHLVDFNDRIVLFGNEYYLVSNRAHTNPRIYNEQALTLVRWY